MKLFKKQRRQIGKEKELFSSASRSYQNIDFEGRMFAALRESLPIVDAAIEKIVRLCGGFEVSCADKTAERLLRRFLREVPFSAAGRGIDTFVASTIDRMLTYGTAVNELLIDSEGKLAAIYGADLSALELREGEPGKPEIFIKISGESKKVPHPERVIVTARNPDPHSPYGVSLLRGLPFLSGVLMKIYESIGINFERMGNLRFAVTYKPNGGEYAPSCADEIAKAWSDAMSDNGSVRDFVAVGDVDIKVIGGECVMPEVSVPVRTILEQITAKTGIPPFLLGLSWSSTERMSSQQADILTGELEYYRGLITPALYEICRTYLRGEGYFCDVDIEWNNISLQDETELARARLYNAQADKIYSEMRGKNIDRRAK